MGRVTNWRPTQEDYVPSYEEYLFSISKEAFAVAYLKDLGYVVYKPTRHEEES